jgi:DNA-binding GntR family transcriptional regulator
MADLTPATRAAGDLAAVGPLPAGATVHVYDHVYRLLRHAIVSGALKPGTRIVEANLAAQLQVSRTPIRDALRRLEGDGLLERSPGGGLEVACVENRDIDDIFRVRAALDRLAAEMATGRTASVDWEPLRRMALGLGPIIERSGTSSYEFNQAHDALHAAVYHLAFGPRVARMLHERLLGLVEIAGGFSYAAEHEEPVVDQHYQLIEALASGDVTRAVVAANEHVAAASSVAHLSAAGEEATDLGLQPAMVQRSASPVSAGRKRRARRPGR